MRQTATVKAIKGSSVLLQCGDEEHCGACQGGALCGPNARVFTAANSKNLVLSPGDRVDVELARRNTVAAGAVVFLLPLLLFFAFYFLTGPVIGPTGEGAKALFGLCGVAVGFMTALVYGKTRFAHQLPQIVCLHSRLRYSGDQSVARYSSLVSTPSNDSDPPTRRYE